MEYDSAMKTNIIVDTTLVNLEVQIKQAKENTHTHTHSKKQIPTGYILYDSMYTIFSNGKWKEMKGFPGIRDEDGVGGREVNVFITR